jgi:hypothetical protein
MMAHRPERPREAPTEIMTAGILALVAAALFTGAALQVTLAEQPARLALDEGALLRHWSRSHERGLALQLSIAGAGSALAALAWWLTGRPGFLVGGLALLATGPFTLRAMMPLSRKLRAIEAGRDAAPVHPLVRRWGTLQATCGLLGAVATALLAATIARSAVA